MSTISTSKTLKTRNNNIYCKPPDIPINSYGSCNYGYIKILDMPNCCEPDIKPQKIIPNTQSRITKYFKTENELQKLEQNRIFEEKENLKFQKEEEEITRKSIKRKKLHKSLKKKEENEEEEERKKKEKATSKKQKKEEEKKRKEKEEEEKQHQKDLNAIFFGKNGGGAIKKISRKSKKNKSRKHKKIKKSKKIIKLNLITN